METVEISSSKPEVYIEQVFEEYKTGTIGYWEMVLSVALQFHWSMAQSMTAIEGHHPNIEPVGELG